MASSPSTADLLARMYRVEKARRFVAEHDEWLANAPPLPVSDGAGQAETSRDEESHTPEELAALAVEVLENAPSALRARSILEVLQEQGVSFVAAHALDMVTAALRLAQVEGRVVMKGRGWWQIPIAGTLNVDSSPLELPPPAEDPDAS